MNSVNESQTAPKMRIPLSQRIANFLISVHPSISDIPEQRRARLSTILAIALTLTNVVSLIFVGREGIDATFFIQAGLTICTFIAYLLSRSPRFVWGSVLLISSLSLSGYANVLSGSDDPRTALFSTIPVACALGSALLPVWGNVTHYILTTIGISVLPFIYPPFTFGNVGTTFSVTFPIGLFLIILLIFRNGIERVRLQEVQSINQELRDLSTKLEQRVADRTKDLATVTEVGTATATILESRRLLQEVVDLTKERFNLYHSHIYLLDEAGKNLVLASGAGEPGRQMVAEGHSIPFNLEKSLVARAAREQKGVIVNDVTQAPDFLPNPLLPDTRSELAVPMLVTGEVIGVFDVQSDVVERFMESDVNILTTLAALVATSIKNVRTFEQSKAQAELESLVNLIGQKIQSAVSVEDTLQTAAREIGLAFGARRVSAGISRPGGNRD